MFRLQIETDSQSPAVLASLSYIARLFRLTLPEIEARDQWPIVCLKYAADETLIPPTPSPDQDQTWTILIPRRGFFQHSFLKRPELPESPAILRQAITPHGFAELCSEPAPRVFQLHFDLIAVTLWFLTRHEEYLIPERDTHGRFLASQSLAPHDLYDQPVVSLLFFHLRRRLLQSQLRTDPFDPLRSNVAVSVTHDVDLIRKYRSPFRSARRSLGVAMRSGFKEAIREVREATSTLLCSKTDPYDSFSDIFATKERMDIRGTWFFQAGGKSQFDCDYQLQDRPIRDLIAEASAWGDEIALHPSYGVQNTSDLSREKQNLDSIIDQQTLGARMHYLRMAIPETWTIIAQTGLLYDATAAFPDRNGFRCGWSGPFRPMNLHTLQELPILAIPLTAMDITLAVYEKISPEHSLERLSAILDAAHVPGGIFTFLWHNTLADQAHYGPYWGTFEYFLYAGGSSMSFRPLRDYAQAYLHAEQLAYSSATPVNA